MSDFDGLTFEQLVAELEKTIDKMAAGDLGIEEVTTLYERAGKLHDAAEARLHDVQVRIEKLKADPGLDARPTTGG